MAIAKGDKEVCPEATPFLGEKDCIKCPDDQYFDAEKSSCRLCSSDSTYSAELKKCLVNDPKQQTSLSSDNLIYSGYSSGELKSVYDTNKGKGLTDCDTATPYYNGEKCISCPKEYPYFNLHRKDCATCSSDSPYDADKHECVKSSDTAAVSPNLETMAAVAFSHEKGHQLKHENDH